MRLAISSGERISTGLYKDTSAVRPCGFFGLASEYDADPEAQNALLRRLEQSIEVFDLLFRQVGNHNPHALRTFRQALT